MTPTRKKKRAPRNRTLELSAGDRRRLENSIFTPRQKAPVKDVVDRIFQGDSVEVLQRLPEASFDLLFADPPYNISKSFGKRTFRPKDQDEYEQELDEWLAIAAKLLKPTASVYICGDWRSSAAIQRAGSRHFTLRNRITWEREKGRGSKTNWKSSSEDIWFFTVSDDYMFNPDDVMLKRRVIAPYKENGEPKDWEESERGRFRMTHPSNLWTDITVPFWSMPENTDHPTQKPEKLLAKLILASTGKGDLILDPFLGSGTTAAAARKLGRHFTGIEIEKEFCLLAARRLELAEEDSRIQGLEEGVFWERNSRT
ncbi:MAG: site-specific DNA-methyltransferase [Acidobacteria bacterium]|nr:MAG: site-specific DNA-methyltransferase [Acidobacteriota bacterium]REJ99043.1 MAG: site-specific DNA-methyltransferase [Acidobacteriota bacterium]REK16236.1 MAG: site-specific DNA-methyltransferase [Acidobacteriota bacterium]REK43917.1 MAG: site-specific DNA-methyltransferase [Acidobacteriota bacterium]